MARPLLPLAIRFACCIFLLMLLSSIALGDDRIAAHSHWISVPVEALDRLVEEADMSAPGETFTMAREDASGLIASAKKSPAGEVMALRSVRLGVGETVTFDPYHVPKDPSHRWSGFTTDDIYVGLQRADDVDGKVTLRGKIGLMDRPQTRTVSEPIALLSENVLALRGFESTENDEPLIQLLLVSIDKPEEFAHHAGDDKFPYHVVHRDGTLAEGQCGSIAEVLALCGEPAVTVIAEGARRPPRISISTPSWRIKFTKRCDDKDLRQIAERGKLNILRLKHCPITDVGLASLAGQTVLTDLQIETSGKITNEGIAAISEMRSLYYLKLQRAELGKESLQTIAALPELRHLHLTDCRLHGEALAALNGNKSLETLNLAGSTSDLAGVRGLGRLEKLKSLDVSGLRIPSMPQPRSLGNGDIAAFEKMKSLTYLNVNHTRVSITGLTQLGEIPQLYVDHRYSRVSDIDAQRMADQFGWTFHGACSCGCLDIEPRR